MIKPEPLPALAPKAGQPQDMDPLSAFRGFQSPPRPAAVSNGRLMLCNIGRAGDTILSNAILDAAFRSFATVDYLCGKHNRELISSDPRLNQVIAWDNSIAGFGSVLKGILRHRYDAYIGLKDCRSSTNLLLARLFRSPVKTGWNSDRFRPFDRDVRGVSVPGIHKVEAMRRIGQLAGLESGEYKPSLVLSPDSIQRFRQAHHWPQPFILLNVSATDASRLWSAENWIGYVQGCDLGAERILVNGLPQHRDQVQAICAKLPHSAPLQPRGFMDVAAAAAHARLVLSVDTGVVHACSALDVPVVALYCGDEYVAKSAPLSTWHLAIQSKPGLKVHDITLDQALAETRRLGLPGQAILSSN